MSKSVAALNEVLLNAALRAERNNAARFADERASEFARRKDNESVSGRTVRARQSEASSASGFVKTNPCARACQGRALMED